MTKRIWSAVCAAGLAFSLGAGAAQAQQLPEVPISSDVSQALQLPPAVQLPQPSVSQPPRINAQNPENYVSLGDSIAANPTMLDIAVQRQLAARPELNVQWPTLRPGHCAQGINNFPSQVAQQTGLRLSDYSCGGATAYVNTANNPLPSQSLNGQVQLASERGALTPSTRLITMSIGVNDLWQPGNIAFDANSQRIREQRFHAEVSRAITRLKAEAPNAEIVLVGIPDQTDGANHTCATNLFGVVSHWYFPFVSYLQDELERSQAKVAADHGVSYLNMRREISAASGKNGCSSDPGRYSAAIFDDQPHNFTFHLTNAGNRYYADRITQTYHQ